MGSVRSEGSGSVRCLVIVSNRLFRILTVIVAALTPADRRRPLTPSVIARRVRSMTSGSDVSWSNVVSWLIDFARSGSSTGSGSIPCARSTSVPPCCPRRRTSVRRSIRWRSPIVVTPCSRNAAAVCGPTPHRREIGSGSRNAASPPGGTTTSPSGLRRSDAIFATSFVVETPTDAVSSSSSWIASLIRRAIVAPSPNRARLAVTSRNASSMEIGSTSGVKRRRIAMTSRLAFW